MLVTKIDEVLGKIVACQWHGNVILILSEIIESLFLNRYAQSVTLNGEKINDKDHEETGYGIWLGWILRIFGKKIQKWEFWKKNTQPHLANNWKWLKNHLGRAQTGRWNMATGK